MELRSLVTRRENAIAYVALDRPAVRNAFNRELIDELHDVFVQLGEDSKVRAVVLSGNGKMFCGGADVNWMRGALDLTHAENVDDARRLSQLYRAIDRCPKLVVARVHGAALGGGAGLVACCDVALAADDAFFGFTETKLGIIPAVISPFVVAKIGSSQARALCLTGERFDAQRALRIGLVHEVVAESALDVAVARVVGELLGAGPTAIAAAKRLLAHVRETPYDATLDLTAQAIAAQRTSAEGQEGLRAFLEKRKAAWNDS
jgi:methylglutaconyl-CoA hydratase